MTKAQIESLLKKLINEVDRTRFIKEFQKYRDTYFNGNFKLASQGLGISREKIGGIFDRAEVPQGGKGSVLPEDIKAPKKTTLLKDLTTKLKKEPNYLKNKLKNKTGTYTVKNLGNILGVDVSTKRHRDTLTGLLKQIGVKSKVVTGSLRSYNLQDTAKQLTKYSSLKKVAGESVSRTNRRLLEKRLDPNFFKFFDSLKSTLRSSSQQAGVYVPRANEHIGHPMSLMTQDKYPKLFKDSNINRLSTLIYQDPVVNSVVLTKTGYDSGFDKILKRLNTLVDKPVTLATQKELIDLKKQLNNNYKSAVNLIENPKELKKFLSKFPDEFKVDKIDFNFFKGQENRIPKIDINIPEVGKSFKSSDLFADMSKVDSNYQIGRVAEINPNAKTLKDLSKMEQLIFKENVINQNISNLEHFYKKAGYTTGEVTELTDTLLTGGERSKGIRSVSAGLKPMGGMLETLKNMFNSKNITIPQKNKIAVALNCLNAAEGGRIGYALGSPTIRCVNTKLIEQPVQSSMALRTTEGIGKMRGAATNFLKLLGRGGLKAAPLAALAAVGAAAEPLVKQFVADDPNTYLTNENQQKGMLLSLLEREPPKVDEEILKYTVPTGAAATLAGAVPGAGELYKQRRAIRPDKLIGPMQKGVGPTRAALGISGVLGKAVGATFSPLAVAATLPLSVAAQRSGGTDYGDIATDPMNWVGPAFASSGAEIASKGIKNPMLLRALRLGMSPRALMLGSRFLGLPGLALTAGMWGYDKWKKSKDDDEFKVRRYRDDDE